MRRMLMLAAAAALVLCGMRDGNAYYGNGPWCAMQSIGHGTITENCSMMSFEQCRLEVVAGNRGWCQPNPRFAGAHASGLVKPVKPRRRAYR